VEIIYLLMTSPKEGFRRIKSSGAFGLFVLIWFLVSGSLVISGKINSSTGLFNNLGGLSASFLIIVFMLLFKILFSTAILHFSAECYGGRGNTGSAFLGFGFSFLPFILITPLFILTSVIETPSRSFLNFLIFVLLSLWVVILQITNIREIYSLSTVRAFMSYITPFMVVLFLSGVLFLSFIANVVSMFLSSIPKSFLLGFS